MKDMRAIFTLMLILIMGAGFAQQDTTQYKFGKKRIIIINAQGDTTADEWDDWDDFDVDEDSEGNDYVEGIGQLQIGANGFMTPENSLGLPAEMSLMELDYSKSRSIAFNTMWYISPMDESRLYISPGFGIEYNNYRFKNNVFISPQNDTVLFSLDTVNTYDKYKLRTTYLQVPLIVGVRLGKKRQKTVDVTEGNVNVQVKGNSKPLQLQVGVIGGYNIGALLKTKQEVDGTRYKNKIKDDFNFNPFRLTATARIGVGDFGFFANYGLTSLFQKDKSPELIPFSVGVQFGGF